MPNLSPRVAARSWVEMRRISKSGTAYNEGSHSSFGDYPRNCAHCHRRIYITKETVWFGHDENGAKASWHWKCRPLRGAA